MRWIGDALYDTSPAGIAGNDDAGTLSAWYVFSAIGLFPIAASSDYWIGAPRFERIQLTLPGGDLVIEAEGASDAHVYIDALTVDGVPWTRPTIGHEVLADGAHLVYTLRDTPGQWGREFALSPVTD